VPIVGTDPGRIRENTRKRSDQIIDLFVQSI